MRRLLFTALVVAVSACNQEKLQRTLPPGVRIDTYAQQAASKVDVLWVVDNSGSMAPRQENLARNFQAFIDVFTKTSIDYRIAVTTTDIFAQKGAFVGSPQVISPQTANVLTSFSANVTVGINGSPYECGLEAGRMAIDGQLAKNQAAVDACKAGCAPSNAACPSQCELNTQFQFLRPDAYLYVAFVTDEEDHSEKDVGYYYRYFETSKGIGNDATVSTAAIIGQPGDTCGTVPGTRYDSLSTLTGGEVGSICDVQFATTLKKLATNAVGLKRKFALQAAPNLQTLEVHLRYPCSEPDDTVKPCASVDRTACAGAAPDSTSKDLVCTPVQGGPDGWSYEATNNVVYFAGDSVPGLHADVELQYYEEGKGP